MNNSIKIAGVLVSRIAGRRVEYHAPSTMDGVSFRAWKKANKEFIEDFKNEAGPDDPGFRSDPPNGDVVTFGVYDPRRKDAVAILRNGVVVSIRVLGYIPSRFYRHFVEDAYVSFQAQFNVGSRRDLIFQAWKLA